MPAARPTKTCSLPGSAARAPRPPRGARSGLGRGARQEDEPRAVVPGRGEAPAERGALAGEESVRHLDQDAGAVSRVGLTAAGAAVEEVLEHLESLADDGVGLPP